MVSQYQRGNKRSRLREANYLTWEMERNGHKSVLDLRITALMFRQGKLHMSICLEEGKKDTFLS